MRIMEKKNPGKKRHVGELWICGNRKCDYIFGRMLTDNTVEIFGNHKNLNPKFIVNFLRIKVRCPLCGSEWIKLSTLRRELFKKMLEEEGLKVDDALRNEERLKKINLEMHGAKSDEELKKAFPDREIAQEIKLKNKLLPLFMTQERRAYDIMVAASREGVAGEEDLAKAVAAGLGMPPRKASGSTP